jgi:hypothetical protein
VKKKTVKARAPKVNWAASVRKFKPRLNALTDTQRRQLWKQTLAHINGPEAAAHVRRG